MSGNPTRFSILRLMIVISIVGAECGLLRAAWGSRYVLTVLIIVPMLNVMFLNLPKLRPGHEQRSFWIGFDVAELVFMAIIFLILHWLEWETFIYPLLYLVQRGWIKEGRDIGDIAIAIACVVAIYTPPQLLAASIIGWFSSRYRVVIERRPPVSRNDPASTSPTGQDALGSVLDISTSGEAPRTAVP